MFTNAKHRKANLTFSLVDRVGLLVEGGVCVALETPWAPLVASGTGLRVRSGFSAALSTGNHKEKVISAADGTQSTSFVIQRRVTSNGERAVVSSVQDEAVHVHSDGQGLRIGGSVPGTGVLKQNTFSFLHQWH